MTDSHCQSQEVGEYDATSIEVSSIVLRHPALWLIVAPRRWTKICQLATAYGWTLPRPSDDHPNRELRFDVRGECAVELSIALRKIAKRYTDRQLGEQFFQEKGWKNRIESLAYIFESGGAAIFWCRPFDGPPSTPT